MPVPESPQLLSFDLSLSCDGVMYLMVGALIVMSILQYGLGLAWRFALECLLLDFCCLREFSPRNRMFRDLVDAGSVPLMEGRLAQDI